MGSGRFNECSQSVSQSVMNSGISNNNRAKVIIRSNGVNNK